MAAYNASKQAVNAFSGALQQEVNKHNICITSVELAW
ncbi:SDR family NAD(P)-dependent oxidoreductase [Phormidium tenue FACHB-886]|nr:SDR family NAD(P)-dependent oxidoreductase [Phormidium tenue FACHB-886]